LPLGKYFGKRKPKGKVQILKREKGFFPKRGRKSSTQKKEKGNGKKETNDGRGRTKILSPPGGQTNQISIQEQGEKLEEVTLRHSHHIHKRLRQKKNP